MNKMFKNTILLTAMALACMSCAKKQDADIASDASMAESSAEASAESSAESASAIAPSSSDASSSTVIDMTDDSAGGSLEKSIQEADSEEYSDETIVIEEANGVTPEAGLLTAGDYDDLLNPKMYHDYVKNKLSDLGDKSLPYIDSKSRIVLTIQNKYGESLGGIPIEVDGEEKIKTTQNGKAYLYPYFDNLKTNSEIEINGKPIKLSKQLLKNGGDVTIKINANTTQRPLDLLVTFDATGSMDDEMIYLQKEMNEIVENIKHSQNNLDVRVGLVVYRDEDDDYKVRKFDFTSKFSKFQEILDDQTAEGGGDTPEAVADALKAGNKLSWRDDAVKVNILVADAPPHDDEIKQTWEQAEKMRANGIQLVSVAASGVDPTAEFLMRAMSQMTQGRYVFLTDDSGIGNPHAEPTVDCYVVTALDNTLTRILTEAVTGERVEPEKRDVIRRVGKYNKGMCRY